VARLRRGTPDDRELLRRLVADYLYELDGTTSPYCYLDAYWEEPERLPFLIEVDGEVAGFCLIRVLDGGWHIAEFSVHPDRRRAGVGRSILGELAAHARAAGASHLEATIHPTSPQALPFWLAVGFEIVDETDRVRTRLAL
jgi:ribosomal protein S18 acetylase RimI-like enzyme